VGEGGWENRFEDKMKIKVSGDIFCLKKIGKNGWRHDTRYNDIQHLKA
jgi:hypothetical protein